MCTMYVCTLLCSLGLTQEKNEKIRRQGRSILWNSHWGQRNFYVLCLHLHFASTQHVSLTVIDTYNVHVHVIVHCSATKRRVLGSKFSENGVFPRFRF